MILIMAREGYESIKASRLAAIRSFDTVFGPMETDQILEQSFGFDRVFVEILYKRGKSDINFQTTSYSDLLKIKKIVSPQLSERKMDFLTRLKLMKPK
ncbi:MAG TPA: hypothetical protein DF383_03815 [Deltaproteobacteria bacterium]|nr:hypothetical protein [Deltaproteobacteria bacterium]